VSDQAYKAPWADLRDVACRDLDMESEHHISHGRLRAWWGDFVHLMEERDKARAIIEVLNVAGAQAEKELDETRQALVLAKAETLAAVNETIERVGSWNLSPERFWAKVRKGAPDECWPWTGKVDPYGYGQFKENNRFIRAHRRAAELTLGRQPRQLILHSCDNPPCCNPGHLREGTTQDNTRDMMERGRGRPGRPSGELNTRARLTWDDVRRIRESKASGADLALEFRCSESNIRAIRSGRSWVAATAPTPAGSAQARAKGEGE
jgi:hypothetical protein